jgi:hypothetical protein
MLRAASVLFAILVGLGCRACEAGVFREVKPGVFEGGLIRLDTLARSITFPAKVNMAEGALEYGIVTPAGSLHESLLSADVDLVDLNAAFLLLGVRVAGGNGATESRVLDAKGLESAPELAGFPLGVFVRWKSGEADKREPLAQWIRYKPAGKTASEGPWLYTGSYFAGNQFAAAAEGAVLCLVTNAAALLNNPREGRKDDRAWEVNEGGVPPVGTEVTVEIELLKVAGSRP